MGVGGNGDLCNTVSTKSYHRRICSFRVQMLEVVSLPFDVDDGSPSSFKINDRAISQEL